MPMTEPNLNALKERLLELLAKSTQSLTKNQIARALNIKGNERLLLKELLYTLEQEGELERGQRRRLQMKTKSFRVGEVLPATIVDVNEDGQLIAAPFQEGDDDQEPTRIILTPQRRSRESALGQGEEVLIRLTKHQDEAWHALILKRLSPRRKPHLGVFSQTREGGRLSSCHRKDAFIGVRLNSQQSADLNESDVVSYTVSPQGSIKILEKIGDIRSPNTFSLMAIYANDLPHTFSQEAIELAEQGHIPPLGDRTDLRHIDLVTIDGEDARDFDDAVWAQADSDPRNEGGWRILVAIADVAYYVHSGTALDQEAKKRGNSVYFPDRVVPMLPEALSNELCSLKPHVDRACLAIEMIITAQGKIKSHRVKRGLMQSRARLTYTQVQQALDGQCDKVTTPLLDPILKPLYGAYQSLLKARHQRGALELQSPERQVILGKDGHIDRIIPRPSFESHKLIEEFMIAANVAAARTLTSKSWPCLFRIHDAPDALRVENLRQILKQLKMTFPKIHKPLPNHFNSILKMTEKTPYQRFINDLILRSQAQAKYSPLNIGHYGLGLSQYAHFTSPIRRYADLVVHRALISALNLGDDGLHDKSIPLEHLGDHVSATERQAAKAEREVMDRFMAAYMAPNIGKSFNVTITGMNKFGLFVSENDTGADGFVPKGTLTDDIYFYEEQNHRLVGRRTRKVYQLGDSLSATLTEADPIVSRLAFRLEDQIARRPSSRPPLKQRGKPTRRG